MNEKESEAFLKLHPDLGDLDLGDLDYHALERLDFEIEGLMQDDERDIDAE